MGSPTSFPIGHRRAWPQSFVSLPLKSLVAVVTRTHYNQKGMHEQTARLLEEHVFASLPCTGG